MATEEWQHPRPTSSLCAYMCMQICTLCTNQVLQKVAHRYSKSKRKIHKCRPEWPDKEPGESCSSNTRSPKEAVTSTKSIPQAQALTSRSCLLHSLWLKCEAGYVVTRVRTTLKVTLKEYLGHSCGSRASQPLQKFTWRWLYHSHSHH